MGRKFGKGKKGLGFVEGTLRKWKMVAVRRKYLCAAGIRVSKEERRRKR